MIIHCSCLSMPCHLGAYTVDLMTDSSALLQASSCSLGSEDVLGGTPQVQVLHQGRPRARQNFHLCPGHKHPNSKQFGEQQNRIKTGSKQDQNRINRVLHNSRVVPLVIFFEECYHQVSWSKTRRKDGKGHGRTVGTQHFQEHSRKIPEDSWYQLTGGAWLVRQAKHSQIFQVANWRHRPPIRIIPTDLDSAVLEVLRASPSSARYLMNFVYLRLFMSLLQANFQSFSTVAVYQFRSSSQSASTRFPLSIQIEAVNQRRTSRINLFLGLQNCHRRAPKHCEITPVSTTVTKKGSGKGWKAGEENMKSLEMLQT